MTHYPFPPLSFSLPPYWPELSRQSQGLWKENRETGPLTGQRYIKIIYGHLEHDVVNVPLQFYPVSFTILDQVIQNILCVLAPLQDSSQIH